MKIPSITMTYLTIASTLNVGYSQSSFDPTSTLTWYHDKDSCGARGDDARADLSQCVYGATLVEDMPMKNWVFHAYINGCGYYAYKVYTCNTIAPSAEPSASPTTAIDLPAPFTLPSPNCTIDVTDGTSLGDVTCTFNRIISPKDAIVSMAIKAYDCVSNYDSTQFNSTVVEASTTQAIGSTTFKAVANVNPSSGYDGKVSFCVRTDLKDANSTETMVYRSEKIELTFSYDGSFEVEGFATTPFVGIGQDATTAVKNFGVTATVCDLTGNTLSNPQALSIGTNLFICIKTDVVGTNIPTITSFIAQKGTDTPYTITGSSPNVVVIGLGSSSVQIIMNLPARFFADTTVIVLSGSVDVTQDSRRRLASARALAEEYTNAEFKMVIEVNNDDDDSSASGRVLMMSTAIFGVVVTLFI